MSDGQYQIPPDYQEVKAYSEGLGGGDMIKSAKNYDLLKLVKGNFVYFNHFRQGFFIYHLMTNDATYSFPVPLDDIGTGTMEHRDKAVSYMRWINRGIQDKTFIKL